MKKAPVLDINESKKGKSLLLQRRKRKFSTKHVKEDVGDFFCRVGKKDLALNKRKRSSAASSAVLEMLI